MDSNIKVFPAVILSEKLHPRSLLLQPLGQKLELVLLPPRVGIGRRRVESGAEHERGHGGKNTSANLTITINRLRRWQLPQREPPLLQ